MRLRNLFCAFGAAALAAVSASAVKADGVGDFYKGKSVDVIISTTTGGGYDSYARLLARFMPEHLPGKPNMTPKNMPGAGGIKAANYLYAEAAQDGSVFGTVQNPVPFQPQLGVKQAMYDATKFGWIGSANAEVGLVFVWKTSKVTKFEDVLEHEITVAGTGGGSSTDFYYRLLNSFVGTKLRSITGYPGSTESFLALERGEVEGFFLFWSSERATYPTQLKNKDFRNIVQFSLEKSKDPALADVPFAPDYIKDPANRAAFDYAVGPLAMGRPFLAPPNVPADRLKALQDAFMATMKDPKFLAQAEKERLDVSGVKSGEEVAALVKKIYQAPPDAVAKVAAITKN